MTALTKAWTKLRPHAKQYQAWTTQERFVALPCGRGSGKSELARRHIVRQLPKAKPWEDPIYFFGLPTYTQAKRVAWKKILALIPKPWIKAANVSEMTIETIFGSTLYVLGMDRPERAEGVQWDGGVLDESCDMKPGVFDMSIMPALTHRNGFCWRIGVPKRYGAASAEFKKFYELGLTGEPIPGTTESILSLTWPSSDILTDEQLAVQRSTMDAKDYNEQYNANWEDAGGSIYWAFSKANISDQASYQSHLPIAVGMDFNIDPMCWVIGHIIGDTLHIFDELFMRNTNTPQAILELQRKWGSHSAGFMFFGDASGKARKTSASKSDYKHVMNADFENKQFSIPKSNPPIADRFAAVNSLCKNAENVHRLFINPSCAHLINDLESHNYKEGTNIPVIGKDLGHITDALGYVIHRRFPIRVLRGDDIPSVSIIGG